jgi:hypothetical protein
VIPGVLKREGEKPKERRWEKSFNNDIIERILVFGKFFWFVYEDKRIMALFLVHVLIMHCVCIRRRPTARQPAGSFILLFSGGNPRIRPTVIASSPSLENYQPLRSFVRRLYLVSWISLPLGDSRSGPGHSHGYRSRTLFLK